MDIHILTRQDIDFDNLEIDDKFLFEELGLTPDEVGRVHVRM